MDKPYLFYSRFLVMKICFMVVSKDVHELTVCHGHVNGPFESNVIFRGFSCSYLLPLPVQITNNKFSIKFHLQEREVNMPQIERGSDCHGHIPLDHYYGSRKSYQVWEWPQN